MKMRTVPADEVDERVSLEEESNSLNESFGISGDCEN